MCSSRDAPRAGSPVSPCAYTTAAAGAGKSGTGRVKRSRPALLLPLNLYVVGTINVDETTHTVSPKVLDRAFTIEMSDVRFGAPVGADAPPIDDEQLLKDFTRAGRFAVVDSSIDQVAANHPSYTQWLQSLSDQLRPFDLNFAYRSYGEILMFVANAQNSSWFDGFANDTDQAFDVAALCKVLPRFAGSRAQLRDPLMLVLAWAINPEAIEQSTVAEQLNDLEWEPASPRLPVTAAKALRMLRRLDQVGFASFA